MIRKETINKIRKAVEHARTKHPEFVMFGPNHALIIAGEEYGELCKAFNDVESDQVVAEALDLIAVCVRIVEGDFLQRENDRKAWRKEC